MNILKSLRNESGLSLRELSQKSGVDQSTISLLENDRHKAYERTLGKLARAFTEHFKREIKVSDFSELVDRTAKVRGLKGGTPNHKSRQVQAASAVSSVVPVQTSSKNLELILEAMEKGQQPPAPAAPAPAKKAAAPTKKGEPKKYGSAGAIRKASNLIATELNVSWGTVKRFLTSLPDFDSLTNEQLIALVEQQQFKKNTVAAPAVSAEETETE